MLILVGYYVTVWSSYLLCSRNAFKLKTMAPRDFGDVDYFPTRSDAFLTPKKKSTDPITVVSEGLSNSISKHCCQ